MREKSLTIKKWIQKRESILLHEHDLQTIIHYAEVGDRAIIKYPQGCANGKITEVLPTGLKVRIWDGEIGTIQFFQWYKIIEIRKLKIKRKMTFLQNKTINHLHTLLTKGVSIMKLNLKAVFSFFNPFVLLAFVMLVVACGSKDDGTMFVEKIGTISEADIESGIYSGKFKVKLKDRDGFKYWIYTNTEFTVGDSLVLVPFSQDSAFSGLQTTNVALAATVEASQATAAVQDSIINVLLYRASAMEAQLAEAMNFKTQVKALIAEVEANETTPSTTVEVAPVPDKVKVVIAVNFPLEKGSTK